MNKYFNKDTVVYDLVTKYPETLDVMVRAGFTPLKNKAMLHTFGKMTKLHQACSLKKIDYVALEKSLLMAIENPFGMVDVSLDTRGHKPEDADYRCAGILPCPIRIPILDGIYESPELQSEEYKMSFDLRAANLGLGDIAAAIDSRDADKIPDALISVGFDTFFDLGNQKYLFEEQGFGMDQPAMNKNFDNEEFTMIDPRGRFHTMAVVPCIFLVNKKVLGDRKCTTWADLLSPEMENSISIPLGDLDMFGAVCISIYKEFGMDGIHKLYKANKQSLHPSQMAISNKMPEPPAVNIIPYFFTTVASSPLMEPVWPEDGAVISPFFITARKDKKLGTDKILEFLNSEENTELFSSNGKFPLTRQGVDAADLEGKKFRWAGWEYLDSIDVTEVMAQAHKIFGIE